MTSYRVIHTSVREFVVNPSPRGVSGDLNLGLVSRVTSSGATRVTSSGATRVVTVFGYPFMVNGIEERRFSITAPKIGGAYEKLGIGAIYRATESGAIRVTSSGAQRVVLAATFPFPVQGVHQRVFTIRANKLEVQ